MELFLVALAVAFMVNGKFDKDKSLAAYKAGKEPPGLARARMRHEHGGGRRSPSGKPKGRGSTRLLLQSRWANACEKAKERGDDRLRRWQQWYADEAPNRDAAWREKQSEKLRKAKESSQRWADRRTRARQTVNPAEIRRRRAEDEAWDRNAAGNEHEPGEQTVPRPAGVDSSPAESTRRGQPVNLDALSGHDGSAQRSYEAATTTGPVVAAQQAREKGRRHWLDQATVQRSNGHGDRADALERFANHTDPGKPFDQYGDAEWSEYYRSAADYHRGVGADDQAAVLDRRAAVHEQRAAGAAPGSPGGQTTENNAETGRTTAETGTAGAAAAMPTQNHGNTNTDEGATVYQQGAQQLTNHADEVEGYQNALAQLGDEMEAAGWGAEVHGPLSQMHASLQQVAGRYRELAEQIRHQGDNVNDAYDEAPWAPDKHALVQ